MFGPEKKGKKKSKEKFYFNPLAFAVNKYTRIIYLNGFKMEIMKFLTCHSVLFEREKNTCQPEKYRPAFSLSK